jgi:hypothetical protein
MVMKVALSAMTFGFALVMAIPIAGPMLLRAL